MFCYPLEVLEDKQFSVFYTPQGMLYTKVELFFCFDTTRRDFLKNWSLSIIFITFVI